MTKEFSVTIVLKSTYPLAFVYANVHCALELYVCAVWKFESSKFSRQEVAVHCVEVFEQIRIH